MEPGIGAGEEFAGSWRGRAPVLDLKVLKGW